MPILPNFDTPNVTSYLSGLSDTGWSTFAVDLDAGFLSAWTSRFTVNPRFMAALGNFSALDRADFSYAARKMAAGIGSGLIPSAVGIIVDDNPGGGTALVTIKVEVSVSGSYIFPATVDVDVEIKISIGK